MNRHIEDFYKEFSLQSDGGHFHKVVPLHDDKILEWDEIHQKVPDLPRGWFELSNLKSKDRVEFTRDFWIAKLPYHPDAANFFYNFFQNVEDIYIFLVQKREDDPFIAHLVYSLKNDGGFFKGEPPVLESEILNLQESFKEIIFPKDYLAFLQIHNGFCKTTDCTGILKAKELKPSYEKFQAELKSIEKDATNTKGEFIDPKSLIPFYKSFGMPFYQCFYLDWYPEDEMGNVYYSGNSNTISDVKKKDPEREAMAFPTFSDWLIFYLETIS